MTIKELIQMINEEGMDIYQLSEAEGFSKGTLRQRLVREGYKQDKTTGKWIYDGKIDAELLNKVITYPSKRKHTLTEGEQNQVEDTRSGDLFTALLQLPLANETYTDSFKTDKALADRMKTFVKGLSLPVGKVYSLAIYEFLEKYEPIIEKLKSKEK